MSARTLQEQVKDITIQESNVADDEADAIVDAVTSLDRASITRG